MNETILKEVLADIFELTQERDEKVDLDVVFVTFVFENSKRLQVNYKAIDPRSGFVKVWDDNEIINYIPYESIKSMYFNIV